MSENPKHIGEEVQIDCEICFHKILVTDKLAVKCPHCGEVWYAFCQYCGVELTDVLERCNHSCNECHDPFQSSFDKYLEKQTEILNEDYSMSILLNKKNSGEILDNIDMKCLVRLESLQKQNIERYNLIKKNAEEKSFFKKEREEHFNFYKSQHSAYTPIKYKINPDELKPLRTIEYPTP